MFDYEGSRSELLKILAEMGEEPAFLERARSHENALNSLVAQCERERNERLKWPRRHFTALRRRVADDWDRLASMVANPDAPSIFDALAAELPGLESPRAFWMSSKRTLLVSFIESSSRFNRSWESFLGDAGLDDVNRRRKEYNDFYPLEKSSAFGFDSVNDRFEPLPMLDDAFLLERFPLLPVLTLA